MALFGKKSRKCICHFQSSARFCSFYHYHLPENIPCVSCVPSKITFSTHLLYLNVGCVGSKTAFFKGVPVAWTALTRFTRNNLQQSCMTSYVLLRFLVSRCRIKYGSTHSGFRRIMQGQLLILSCITRSRSPRKVA